MVKTKILSFIIVLFILSCNNEGIQTSIDPEDRTQTKFFILDSVIGSDVVSDGMLHEPEDMVFANNAIYVVDSNNHRINKYDIDGNFILSWGNSAGPFQGNDNGEFIFPRGIATDTTGNIYVVDTQNDRVQIFDKDGLYLRQFGNKGSGNGEFDFPFDIKLDSDNNIYIADTYNYRVQKFTNTGVYITSWTTFDKNDEEYRPRIIEIKDSKIYVKCVRNSIPYSYNLDGTSKSEINEEDFFQNIVRYEVVSSSELKIYDNSGVLTFTITGLKLNDDMQVYLNDSYIYILDKVNFKLEKINSFGVISKTIGSDLSNNENLNTPRFMDLDASDNLYVADQYNQTIKVFNSEGVHQRNIGTKENIVYPMSVSYSKIDNTVFVSHQSGISQFSTSGTFINKISSQSMYGDIEIYDNGKIYYTAINNNIITILNSDGTLNKTWGTTGSSENCISSPNGINFDINNNLIIADKLNHRIKTFELDGSYKSFYTHLDAANVIDMDVDTEGNIYMLANNPSTTKPAVIVVDEDHHYLGEFGYTSNSSDDFDEPASIRVTSSGNIFISDSNRHNIKIYKSDPNPRSFNQIKSNRNIDSFTKIKKVE